MENINKEDLFRKTKGELVTLAGEIGIEDDCSDLSKAQIIDLISAKLLDADKVSEDNISVEDTTLDKGLTAFKLELAKRKSKFNTGVQNLAADSSDVAFKSELSRRSSRFNVGVRQSFDIESAFQQELNIRESKHK